MIDFKTLTDVISPILGSNFEIFKSTPLSGGDINDVYHLNTSYGHFCIKLNDALAYPDMFQQEARGLNLLRQSEFTIPDVIQIGQFDNKLFLLIEYIKEAQMQHDYWTNFGRKLAEMHQITQSQFGLDSANYIGSLKQSNNQHITWKEFFLNERILPQIKLGIDTGKLSLDDQNKANSLYHQIDSIFPEEKPALLHGDLWNGNTMIDNQGNPALIDPAVYFGHREMDLAMTKLFGGFSSEMYAAYHSEFPLEKNWEERIEIHNLYPLLVHVNLFGGSYVSQVRRILKRYD